MLRARCGAAIARAVYPDLVAGIYDPDEVAEITRHDPTPAPRALPEASPVALEQWREAASEVLSLGGMYAAWQPRAEGIHLAGRADAARTIASERAVALGYTLTTAELQSVLAGAIDPAMASALDEIAATARHADDEDGDLVVADLVVILRGIASASAHTKVTAFRSAIKHASALGIEDAKSRLTAACLPRTTAE